MRDLNRLYAAEPVLGGHDLDARGFRWINCNDAERSAVSYLRLDEHERVIFAVVGSYTPVIRHGSAPG